MKLLIALVAIALTACGTPRSQTMAYNDLNYYVANCNQPEQQLAFLGEQLRNAPDQHSAAAIKVSMRYIRDWCPTSQRKVAQGCVTARETFTPGSSTAVVCRFGPEQRPLVNRWEADIDR
jgi:hypothetical protein